MNWERIIHFIWLHFYPHLFFPFSLSLAKHGYFYWSSASFDCKRDKKRKENIIKIFIPIFLIYTASCNNNNKWVVNDERSNSGSVFNTIAFRNISEVERKIHFVCVCAGHFCVYVLWNGCRNMIRHQVSRQKRTSFCINIYVCSNKWRQKKIMFLYKSLNIMRICLKIAIIIKIWAEELNCRTESAPVKNDKNLKQAE